MGTLGLAWTGDLKNAGGVCEKNGVSLLNTIEKKYINIYMLQKFVDILIIHKSCKSFVN